MKELFIQILAFILLILTLPLLFLLFILIKLTDKGPFMFKQKRTGKNNNSFLVYKIRTMVVDAENLKSKIEYLNEVDGPVFKIHNDPRYTKIGKFLSHTGLDELPQLINIIKGEMDFVGPRPLPVSEAKLIPQKYQKRLDVLPGITSPWILQGAHKLSFKEWMESDIDYIQNKTIWYDSILFIRTFLLILSYIYKKLFNKDEGA
ncbi:MAG: sugar transferase [Candidatus Roizmanbacteria bacterium]|nr:sugar transferase [Candidatus Roizmanbacteria bacterium]